MITPLRKIVRTIEELQSAQRRLAGLYGELPWPQREKIWEVKERLLSALATLHELSAVREPLATLQELATKTGRPVDSDNIPK
jgi:hypothetical protein